MTSEAQPHPGPSTASLAGPRNDFTSRNLGTGRSTIQCTACGEYSHWRRECPYDNYCITCNNHDHATHMCRAHRQTNNRSQQGQQSPLIFVYCGSIEHSLCNCHRRPWDNREQPCSTPDSLRRNQPSNSKILGWNWCTKCELSFQLMKDFLISAPILKYPDTSKPYTLFTDASKYGWAGVLTQENTSVVDGKEVTANHPVSFVSGMVHGSQLNWAAMTKEAYTIYMTEIYILLNWSRNHVKE